MEPLVAEGICKSFAGRPVLRQVSFSLPAGQAACLMGPSGCGKTTLLRLLMGLLQPDAGRVTGLPGQTGAVFQEDLLLEGFSCLYNAAFSAPQPAPARVLDHLAQLGLAQEARRPVDALSGGMRRRVALARAVLSGGQLLLLDEPFKGLDEATRDLALQYLQRNAAGRSLLLATHDPQLPRLLGAQVIRLPLLAGPAAP